MPTNHEFIPVDIEMLRANCPFTFDLYIKINEKFIHYIRKGDDIDDSRLEKFKLLEKLKEKNVELLFITRDDQDSFGKFIDISIDETINDKSMSPEDKFSVIEKIAQHSVEVIFSDPDSQQAYHMTEKASTGLRKLIQKNPKALKNIFKKRDHRDTTLIENHSKNVAALATRMAFAMGFRGKDLDNIGNAALLHDIGLTKLNREEADILFTRPPKIFSSEDKRIYHRHVMDGVNLLSDKKYVNPAIIALIRTHEESKGGNGYPDKIMDLEPLEEILSLVNCYEKKVNALKMGPIKAFKDLQINEAGKYNLGTIKKLKEVLDSEEVFALDE